MAKNKKKKIKQELPKYLKGRVIDIIKGSRRTDAYEFFKRMGMAGFKKHSNLF